jgi:hypothetical protein
MNWMVALVSSFFALMGVAALAAPAKFVSYLGSQIVRDEGRNEVRAVYGGFGLAIAGSLVWAASRPDVREGYFLCLIAACLGMAGGRVFSLIVDRSLSPTMAVAMAVEATLAVLLMVSLG